MTITEQAVINALRGVKYSDNMLISDAMVSGIAITENKITFVLNLPPEQARNAARIKEASENAVKKITGVPNVIAVVTAEKSGTPPLKKAVWNTNPIHGVAKIIAVSSGKGGVGKSTTAVNLALALQRRGHKVGLLDADIYGPSLPRMLGINQQPEIRNDRIIPLVAHNLKCMSIGFLVGEDSAIIWRGPQATKALYQMLRDVEWGELDYLLVDMPPGTGDVHLSLVQQVPVNGAVIVTTPQDVALADARKSIDMFQKVNVPILGVIENMAGFPDPDTGKIHAIFGEGGGKRLAAATGSMFLGSIPIDIALRIASDNGEAYPDPAHYYNALAAQL